MKKLFVISALLCSTLLVGCGAKNSNANPENFPVETFTSQRLGVSFNFIDDLTWVGPNGATVILSGDTIAVGPHSLEVIKKEEKISGEDFVQSLTKGYKSDCTFKIETGLFFETGSIITGYQKITLWNKSPGDFLGLGNGPEDIHCNNTYANSFQQTYFLYNPEVSGKIIFLNLGQEGGLRGSGDLPRMATIKIF